MNTDRNLNRMLDLWFAEGFDEVNDHVLDAVEGRVRRQRQRPGWLLVWRDTPMNGYLKLAIGVAAVLVVAVGAWQLLPGRDGNGGLGTPVPTASPPASSPSPPEFTLTYDPELPYLLHLTTPAGWFRDDSEYVLKKATAGSELAIATWVVENVYRDGCRWADSIFDPPVGSSIDDLATAFASLEDREVTTPVERSLDGFDARDLTMTIPTTFDAEFSACDEGGIGTMFRYWTAPGGGVRYSQGPGERQRLLLIDVDGTRVLVLGRTDATNSAAEVDEVNSILDAMQVESLAAPSASP